MTDRSISTMPRPHRSIRRSSPRWRVASARRRVRKSIRHESRTRTACAARIEQARAEVAALVGANPEQIVWTSGATEANNLALLGVARFNRDRRHIVTSRTEHPAVLDACRQLEREGVDVTYLKPRPNGIVEPAQVAAALRADTLLVSLMHVNNEIGVVQDVAAVGACAASVACSCTSTPRRARARSPSTCSATASTCCRSPPTRCMARKASVRCACVANHGLAWCRCSSVAGRSAVCVRARCRRTRSWAWARPTGSRGTNARGHGSHYRTARAVVEAPSSLPGVQLNGDPRTPCRGHPQRHDRRGRGREPALRAVRPGRFIGLGVRHRAASRRTCCARSGAATGSPRVPCALVSAASRRRTRSSTPRGAFATKSSACARLRRDRRLRAS